MPHMSIRRGPLVGFMLLCVTGAGTGISRGAVPGADDPKAYTQHNLYRDRLDFNRRQIVERYKQVGRREPAWDDDALTLLDGVCVSMAQAGVGYHYQPKAERTPWPTLLAAGARAIEAGCDDSAVLDAYAVALIDNDRKPEARPHLERAVEQILQSQYSAYRAAMAVRRLRDFYDKTKHAEEYARLDKLFWDCALAATCEKDLPGRDRRLILNGIWDEFAALPVERKQQIALRIAQIGADPWISAMIEGEYWHRYAWSLRGGGYAHTVRDEGWKGFAENLPKARAHFEEAYRLHPEFPEAATMMISLQMADSKAGESERMWFDRAVAAQFDHLEAYDKFLWAMRPRWHGSHEIMYQFGLECAQTRRYDTDIPNRLLTALEEIREDDEGDWSFYRRPGVLEAVREVSLAYAARSDPSDHDYYLAWLAGLAWQTDRWADGKQAVEQLDFRDPVANLRGFHNAEVIPARTISGCHALAGPHADSLRRAEQFAAVRRWDEAAKIYEEVAANLEADDPATLFVRGRAREHRWTAQFQSGHWVDLTPGERLDGWYPIAGEWSMDQGVLVGTTDDKGTLIACGLKVGPRYEFVATVELEPAPAPPDAAGTFRAGAGPLFGLITARHYYMYSARPNAGQALWSRFEDDDFKFVARHKAELDPKRNTLGAMLLDGKFTATANGSIVVRDRATSKFTRRDDARVGLALESAWPGTVVRFAELRVRRMEPRPKSEPQAEPQDDR